MKTAHTGLWIGLLLFCSWAVRVPAFAAPLDLAIKADVLDEAVTQMWRDGDVVPDAVNQLHSVLGVTNVVPNYIGWNAGRVAEDGTPSEFVYRVAANKKIIRLVLAREVGAWKVDRLIAD